MAALALLASVWNGVYNTAFDWIEGRLTGRPADLRPWPARALHATGFEAGHPAHGPAPHRVVDRHELARRPHRRHRPGRRLRGLRLRLQPGLRQDFSHHPAPSANRADIHPESPSMPTTTLIVTGMQSDDCLRTVMNAIQDLPCINHADVSLATGEATIDHTSMVSEGDIRAAIEDAGFPTR
jgi:copper chaperone CopZ